MNDQNSLLPGLSMGQEAGISAYLHRKSAAAGIPLSGTFELTSRCNFNCRMCYIHSAQADENDAELTAQQWIDIASQASNAGMLFLLLTGGEPLLRADFEEIYGALCKMGFFISVNTNGSLLKGRIAALFEKNPPNRINISLYGASGETYRSLCGTDRFDAVKESIEQMTAAGIDVRLNVSVTPENVHELDAVFAFASERNLPIKATPYMFPPVRGTGTYGKNEMRLSAEAAGKCRAAIESAQLSAKELQNRLSLLEQGERPSPNGKNGSPSPQGAVSRCRAGRAGFWVDWNGGVRMCGMTPVCAELSSDNFREAWEAVRTATCAIRLPAECTACPLRQICPVCAAVCCTETGEYGKKPTYLCEMTKAYAEELLRMRDKTSR